MFNYYTNVHEATKHTPYELVFGKTVRIPSNEPLAPEDKLANYDKYIINLVSQLHSIQGNARKNIIEAKFKSKKYYDRKIKPQTFKPGDHVFLLKGPKPDKFGDQYTGLHQVLEIFNKNNIKIRIKKNSRIIHPNRLRYRFPILNQVLTKYINTRQLIHGNLKAKVIKMNSPAFFWTHLENSFNCSRNNEKRRFLFPQL